MTPLPFRISQTLMQARIEFDKELASRGPEAEFEDEEQDLTEFCEDRFVELYGLKKIATENLRDMIKGTCNCARKEPPAVHGFGLNVSPVVMGAQG
jgi:hypothetical protein